MLALCSFILCERDASAILITGTLSPAAIEAALFAGGGMGVDLSSVSVTVSGHTMPGVSAGTYTNFTGTYGIGPGVIISSGNAVDYGDGMNTSPGFTTDYGVMATAAQEALLDPITGGMNDHFDATQIDIAFDMLPGFADVFFRVTFGSEEYAEFQASPFIDAFGMFVNGTNVAFVDGAPINVDHENMGTAPGTELDGVLGSADTGAPPLTPAPAVPPLFHTFTSPVMAMGNTLTFIIADSGDGDLDSTAYISQLGGSPPPPPGQVIPEPASLAVWSVLGMLGAGIQWRRRKKTA